MTSAEGRDEHVADFLAMLTAERGASPNTIDAYAADLEGFIGFLSGKGVAPKAATGDHVQDYLGFLANEGQAPTSRA
ncbi:MAG TPA: site-specific integrase, partial [Hyphomicrobium sp.]|nr:site-specific integrase [Hyphomicrobium sp.]